MAVPPAIAVAKSQRASTGSDAARSAWVMDTSRGVRVVGVNPGAVATERFINFLKLRAAERLGDAARYEELLASYPLQRAADPREIADLVVYLASPRSGYTSGSIFTVDGGVTSRRSI